MNSTSIYRLYPSGYFKGNLNITDDEARDRGMPSAAELVGCVGEVYTEEAAKEARRRGFIVEEEKMDTDDTDWYKDHCCGCDAALATDFQTGKKMCPLCDSHVFTRAP